MKGNFNGLLAGLAGWLLVALGGFILWLLYRAVGSFTLLYLAAAVYFTALGVVFDRLLLAYGTRRSAPPAVVINNPQLSHLDS